MGTCLVTTLKESVSDNSLLKLGDIRFHVYHTNDKVIFFYTNQAAIPAGKIIHVEVKSPGYITDSTGTANLGQSFDFRRGYGSVYLISGDYDVILSNKYIIPALGTGGDSVSGSSVSKNMGLDLKDLTGVPITTLKMSAEHLEGTLDDIADNTELTELVIPSPNQNVGIAGDIGALTGMENLVTLYAPKNRFSGDVSVLAGMENLQDISLLESPLEGNIDSLANLPSIRGLRVSSKSIYGTTSALGGMTSLVALEISNTSVSGNLSSLASLTNLTGLWLNGTDVVGDTSSLAGLTNLNYFNYANTAITGTWPLA